jgi:hypothetical protein
MRWSRTIAVVLGWLILLGAGVVVGRAISSGGSASPQAPLPVTLGGSGGAGAGQGPSSPPYPRGAVVETPNVTSDCSGDVTEALSQWLYSLPAGTPTRPVVVRFEHGACYRVDGSLYLRNFRDYLFDGNGSVFRQVSPTVETTQGFRPASTPYCGSGYTHPGRRSGEPTKVTEITWWFEGGCDLVIENLHIEGPNSCARCNPQVTSRLQVNSGIQLNGVQRALITKSTVRYVDGDFVTVSGLHEVAGGGAAYPSTDVSIVGNTFDTSGREGVSNEYVNRVRVMDNSLRRIGASVFDLEADVPGGCTCNVDIEHNDVSGSSPYLLAALTGSSVDRFAFSYNRLSGGAAMQVQISGNVSSNLTIAGNAATTGSSWPYSSIELQMGVRGPGTVPLTGVEVWGNVLPYSTNGKPFVFAGPKASKVMVGENRLYARGHVVPFTSALPGAGSACGNQQVSALVGRGQATPLDGTCPSGYVAPAPPQPPRATPLAGA